MDEIGFDRYLKRRGKKAHVIAGLAQQVKAFEQYLAAKSELSLVDVDVGDVQAYALNLVSSERKKAMRALALYFTFQGWDELVGCADSIREVEVAKTRKPTKLMEFRGIDEHVVEQLQKVGIVSSAELLAAGMTTESRAELARNADIP